MSRHLSKKLKQTAAKVLTPWDEAIYDAEGEILRAKTRIQSLTVSIARFKEFRDSGEPWPSKQVEQANTTARQS